MLKTWFHFDYNDVFVQDAERMLKIDDVIYNEPIKPTKGEITCTLFESTAWFRKMHVLGSILRPSGSSFWISFLWYWTKVQRLLDVLGEDKTRILVSTFWLVCFEHEIFVKAWLVPDNSVDDQKIMRFFMKLTPWTKARVLLRNFKTKLNGQIHVGSYHTFFNLDGL